MLKRKASDSMLIRHAKRLAHSNAPPNVLLTRSILPDAKHLLTEHGFNVTVLDTPDTGLSEAQLIEHGHNAHAMITMLSDSVTSRVLESCPNLKVVAQYAVGVDNIDVQAARSRGVVVTHTPDVLSAATADQAFALLLGVARNVVAGHKYVQEGRFKKFEVQLMLGLELNGAKLGIVGMGRIGQEFAKRAKAFGMEITYYNRSRLEPEVEAKYNATYVPLEKLLQESDVVSLHCPLTPESKHLISKERLAKMKPSCIIINTSRGPVIDEAALAEALKEKRIGGAGLDVFEREPIVHEGLVGLDNVVLAPHLGSATVRTRGQMSQMCGESVLAVLTQQEEIPHVLKQ